MSVGRRDGELELKDGLSRSLVVRLLIGEEFGPGDADIARRQASRSGDALEKARGPSREVVCRCIDVQGEQGTASGQPFSRQGDRTHRHTIQGDIVRENPEPHHRARTDSIRPRPRPTTPSRSIRCTLCCLRGIRRFEVKSALRPKMKHERESERAER